MPRLKNIRQERFAQGLFKGLPQVVAYEKAGYDRSDPNASRLTRNDKIQQRLQELVGSAEIGVITDRNRIAEELATIAYAPIGDEVITVKEKRGALMDIAKLAGHLVDRKEIKRVEEFESMTDDELHSFLTVTYEQIGESPVSDGYERFGEEEEEETPRD